jgi:hypothetical protein
MALRFSHERLRFETSTFFSGLIGESVRGRPHLITLTRDERNILPCLSCLSPEKSRATLSPNTMGGLYSYKQLMR